MLSPIFAAMILSCHTEGDNANDLSHSRAKPSASVWHTWACL